MEHHLLAYDDSVISYYRFGNGPKTAFCFHGYGEEASIFQFLGKAAGHLFTFYSIDLPFHGKTRSEMDPPFTVSELEGIIRQIMGDGDEKITIIGFSLGGRIALGLYESMAPQVERMLLLAPDGLKVNGWYWLSTQTWAGNKFFSFTMRHPGWFTGLLRLFNNLGIVNPSIFKFVKYYTGDPAIRQLLYQRWTSLRRIKPSIPAIRNSIKKNNTKVRLLYGRHDRIILSSVGEKFRKGIETYCSIRLIAAGHQVLHAKHIDEIMPALLD